MNEDSSLNPNKLLEIQNCLFISIDYDLYEDLIKILEFNILNKLKNSDLVGVILDLSKITIIDSFNLKALIKLKKMINLMGKELVIIGIQPTVASALTEFSNLELEKLIPVINISAAIQYLKKNKKNKKQKTSIRYF